MPEEQKEKILFQYIMNYKAYRRIMISSRVLAILVLAGGSAALCVVSVAIGIFLAITFAVVGTISIFASLGTEWTYTVYNTRVVLKKRNSSKRLSVPMESITRAEYRRAFYERDLGTGTVTVKATVGGKRKSYKLKHVFDAMPAVEYMRERIAEK